LCDVFPFTLRAKVNLYACGNEGYCHLIQGYGGTQELSARVSLLIISVIAWADLNSKPATVGYAVY